MTNPTESAEEEPSSSDQQPQEKNSPLNAPVIQEITRQNESNMTDQSEKSDEGDNNVKSHGGDQEKTEGIGGSNLENEKGQESGATGGGSSASISGRKRGRKGDAIHVGSSSGSNSKARKKVELEVVPSCAPTCYVCKRTFWSWKAVFGHLRTHRRQTPGAFPPPTFTPEGSTEKNNKGDKPLKEQLASTLLNLTRETMQKMSQDSHTTVSAGAASSSSRRGLDIDLNEPITRVLLDLDEPPPP